MIIQYLTQDVDIISLHNFCLTTISILYLAQFIHDSVYSRNYHRNFLQTRWYASMGITYDTYSLLRHLISTFNPSWCRQPQNTWRPRKERRKNKRFSRQKWQVAAKSKTTSHWEFKQRQKKSQPTLVAFFLQAMSGSLPPALGQRELNQEDRRASPICLPIRASRLF